MASKLDCNFSGDNDDDDGGGGGSDGAMATEDSHP